MADWAFAIELDSQRYWAQAQTNGGTAGTSDSMRRLTVTVSTASPPSRQLLTVVRCCHCGLRSGLPTDYSTPFQCLGFSGLHMNQATTTAAPAADSTPVSSAETSPQSASTSNAEQQQRIACRHIYCLGCQWLVNGEFRTLHPIEIRDESDYSAYGYNSQYTQQQESSSSDGHRRGNGRRSGS